MKCQIRWINKQGQATPDDNEAVMLARTIDRTTVIAGRPQHFSASEWFPICAEHALRLHDPGMEIWETTPLKPEVVDE